MEIINFLSKLGFVAVFGSALVALMNWRLGLNNAVRADMKQAWTSFKASAGYGCMDKLADGEPSAILFLTDDRVAALTFLHDLESMAAHSRRGRISWSDIIPNAEYGRLRRAVTNAMPLVVLARATEVELEVQVWADRRQNALAHTIRAFGKRRFRRV